MTTPAEPETEELYRAACDKVLDRLSSVMQSLHDVGKNPDELVDHYGNVLCDLAEIQGFLFKVCAAGVNKDTKSYLSIINDNYTEISK